MKIGLFIDIPAYNSGNLSIFLFLLTAIISFLCYWLTIESQFIKERFNSRFGEEKGSLYFFIFNKAWGALWFGVICTVAAVILFPDSGPAGFGLKFPDPGAAMKQSLLWSAVLLPFIIAAIILSNRSKGLKQKDFGRYPEIRMKQWSASTLIIHISMWSIYLFAYELMFRGTLLLPLSAAVGWWPAIGINVVFYAAAHVPKGAGEAVGALVLGFILCLITLSTGSILVAFLVHAALALGNGLGAFVYNENMTFYRGNK